MSPEASPAVLARITLDLPETPPHAHSLSPPPPLTPGPARVELMPTALWTLC